MTVNNPEGHYSFVIGQRAPTALSGTALESEPRITFSACYGSPNHLTRQPMSLLTAHQRFEAFFKLLSDPAWLTTWKGHVVRQSAPRWMSLPYRFTGIGSVFRRWPVECEGFDPYDLREYRSGHAQHRSLLQRTTLRLDESGLQGAVDPGHTLGTPSLGGPDVVSP